MCLREVFTDFILTGVLCRRLCGGRPGGGAGNSTPPAGRLTVPRGGSSGTAGKPILIINCNSTSSIHIVLLSYGDRNIV